MSKRIFIIESDAAFSNTLERALTIRGLKVRTADNSEQGVLQARGEPPDLFVVCVEAQPTNGYMICTRLKKEDALRNIPVILISANATPESFEKHKKLKTRAEEYLIKPFPPEVILEKIGQLLGIDLPGPHQDDEASLVDEPLGLGALVTDDEPVNLSRREAAEAHGAPAFGALVEEGELVEAEEVSLVAPRKAAGTDDDLKNFEAAFDAISPTSARPDQPGPTGESLVAAAPELPQLGEAAVLAEGDSTVVNSAHTDELIALEARVHQLETDLISRNAELEVVKRSSGSSADLLKLKEARTKGDKEILRLKQELNEKQKELNEKESELIELRDQQMTFESQAQQLKDDGLKRDAAAKALQQRAEGIAAAAKKFERELVQAREELKPVAGLKARLSELESAEKTSQELKQRLAEQTTDLEKQRTRADESTAEAERQRARAAELESSLTALRSQLETQSAQLNLDLARAKEEANRLRAELAQTAAEHEQATADLEQASSESGRLKAEGEQLRQEAANLKADLAKAKAEVEKAQAEVQRAQAEGGKARAEADQTRRELQEATGEKALVVEERDDLTRQLGESQAAVVRNEERAVKAYQRIKGDEKLREKTRKALQIALQLLDEAGPAPEELAPAPDGEQAREPSA